MKEWNDPWNPFNSAKVLVWREHLENCAKDNYLPPVTVDIDPSNRCMYDCPHCNAYDIIKNSGENMSGEHMIKLVDFLADWRDSCIQKVPNSACVSGGGEPYMNKEINTLFERMYEKGMQAGIITTGFILSDEDIKIAAKSARWIGFSMDSAKTETYNKIKGLKSGDSFNKVIENIKKLTKEIKDKNYKCDVAYKFLMTPDNALEIYDAIKLAKEIGTHDFHLRPVGWDNLSKTKGKEKLHFENLTNEINKQLEEGMKLESENFKVYGIRHKFNPDFSKKINFSRCRAIPMLPTFSADGNVHLCFDMRGNKDLILCRHYPDPTEVLKVWNTDKHKDLVKSIDVNKCPRCTFGTYNEIIEKVIIDDSMCRFFP